MPGITIIDLPQLHPLVSYIRQLLGGDILVEPYDVWAKSTDGTLVQVKAQGDLLDSAKLRIEKTYNNSAWMHRAYGFIMMSFKSQQ